jgi:hypothetical protein
MPDILNDEPTVLRIADDTGETLYAVTTGPLAEVAAREAGAPGDTTVLDAQ